MLAEVTPLLSGSDGTFPRSITTVLPAARLWEIWHTTGYCLGSQIDMVIRYGCMLLFLGVVARIWASAVLFCDLCPFLLILEPYRTCNTELLRFTVEQEATLSKNAHEYIANPMGSRPCYQERPCTAVCERRATNSSTPLANPAERAMLL